MVGFRVIDVGALVVFLVWFFRQRFDADDPPDDDGPGGSGPQPGPQPGPGGGGLPLPLDTVRPSQTRLRSHGRPDRGLARRGGPHPLPPTQPARVRRPASPAPVHRRH